MDLGVDQPKQLFNRVISRLEDGYPVFGLTARLIRGPEAVMVARSSGHDFVRVDRQHSLQDLETISQVALTGIAFGYPTLVRTRGVFDPDMPSILDSGISGVIVPNVESASDAESVVEAVRFPPLGRRSYGGSYPHFGYAPTDPDEAAAALNRSTLVVCMIESQHALDHAEQIAAVPGIDVIHLGVSDLLLSMGSGGDRRWLLDEGLDHLAEVAGEADVYLGAGGLQTVEEQVAAVERGVRLITTRADGGFLLEAATDWLRSVRTGVGE